MNGQAEGSYIISKIAVFLILLDQVRIKSGADLKSQDPKWHLSYFHFGLIFYIKK